MSIYHKTFTEKQKLQISSFYPSSTAVIIFYPYRFEKPSQPDTPVKESITWKYYVLYYNTDVFNQLCSGYWLSTTIWGGASRCLLNSPPPDFRICQIAFMLETLSSKQFTSLKYLIPQSLVKHVPLLLPHYVVMILPLPAIDCCLLLKMVVSWGLKIKHIAI